jgi:hypothetical protein
VKKKATVARLWKAEAADEERAAGGKTILQTLSAKTVAVCVKKMMEEDGTALLGEVEGKTRRVRTSGVVA